MFLHATEERNPELIDVAIQLHQNGSILPDTYVLDVDMILENARLILEEADKYNIRLYFMLKQIGRNPKIAELLVELGYESAVVVDFNEARQMMNHGIPLGNVGNLVQIPKHFLKEVMTYGTEYITVFSIEKLNQVNEVAKELGIKQKILMKVVDKGDAIYEGQHGGFCLKGLFDLTDLIHELKYVELAGVTSFPCFLYDMKKEKLKATQNAETILKAQELLVEAGFPVKEINMPSTTSVYTMPFISELGGTEGEPGHALTGTTPMHAVLDLPEKPAYVYVSEVSHNFNDHAYIYGGGLYRRGHLKNILLHDGKEERSSTINPFNPENIDYYLEVAETQPVGATAIMVPRTQIFVTRSEVALVKGIQNGNPEIIGIYSSLGEYLRR